ncbi:mannose-6-phosphate isomerase [Lactifluus subvellereus]|nr:mannose-6-phosphate isomerase [Lactifluus subvellereus]
MALAITPFTALFSFLPLAQIATYLANVPGLSVLVPCAVLEKFSGVVPTDSNAPAAKQALRDVFSAVMTPPTDAYTTQLAMLIECYEASAVHAEEESVRELVLGRNTQFPDDIGMFCTFLLGVKLSSGEVIFLGAEEPHAYISANIIECMANSDNVIRAGLTPKLRDIPNLLGTLTYRSACFAPCGLHASVLPCQTIQPRRNLGCCSPSRCAFSSTCL